MTHQAVRACTVVGLITAVLAAPGVGSVAAAQSRRMPTPAEAAVITRFYGVLLPMLDAFGDASWAMADNSFRAADKETIALHANVPLDDCIGGARTYRVLRDSPRYNAVIKPLDDKIKQASAGLESKIRAGTLSKDDMAEAQRLGDEEKRLSSVHVEACGNRPSIETAVLRKDQPSIVPGLIAHKLPAQVCGTSTPCVVLAYGDWAAATPASGGRLQVFKFTHPPASPYLENIVVTIDGAEDRVDELLKTIDWTKLNDALTR